MFVFEFPLFIGLWKSIFYTIKNHLWKNTLNQSVSFILNFAQWTFQGGWEPWSWHILHSKLFRCYACIYCLSLQYIIPHSTKLLLLVRNECYLLHVKLVHVPLTFMFPYVCIFSLKFLVLATFGRKKRSVGAI